MRFSWWCFVPSGCLAGEVAEEGSPGAPLHGFLSLRGDQDLGRITVSITWITPLLPKMSVLVIFAEFTVTVPSAVATSMDSPFRVFRREGVALLQVRVSNWGALGSLPSGMLQPPWHVTAAPACYQLYYLSGKLVARFSWFALSSLFLAFELVLLA